MRIIEVTSEQFHSIWGKLQPQMRFTGDVPTPAIVLPYLNTMFVLRGEIQYGTLEQFISLADLPSQIEAAVHRGVIGHTAIRAIPIDESVTELRVGDVLDVSGKTAIKV